MISELVIDSIIKNAKCENKDFLLKIFILNLSDYSYSYNDYKVNRALELMLDNSKFIENEHIDMDYITQNIAEFIYKGEKYEYKDIYINRINNIEGTIEIRYKYKDKDKEEDYTESYFNVNFIENPQVLKKS